MLSFRRKFRSQASDNMDRQIEKQRWEESAKRKEEERRSEKRKSQKKEDGGARKGRKVVTRCVFPIRGSKSRLAKAAGAGPSGGMRAEKLHAVVARSTFGSEKTDSTSRPEQLRC